MINTYIINLEQDTYKYKKTLDEFDKTGYDMNNVHRYNAINGSKINRYDQDIHPICKTLCTDKVIGTGLSHIDVCKQILKTNSKYALIVEDDIKINGQNNLNDELNNTIKDIDQIDPGWDIIVLHLQGICEYKKRTTGYLCGSAAAYLISRKGMEKMAKLKLGNHVDYNRNSLAFNTYSGPNIFDTYEDDSMFNILNTTMIFNKSISFWFNQHVIRIPFFNKTLNGLSAIILLVILFTTIRYSSYLKYGKMINYIITLVLTSIAVFFHYGYKYVGYNITGDTQYLGMILPALSLIYIFTIKQINRKVFYALYIFLITIFMFHMIRHFDRSVI
tara:strand:- start:4824 stop:5819 length:996 start_codon:yes stop_codon:yes gene_type:complete